LKLRTHAALTNNQQELRVYDHGYATALARYSHKIANRYSIVQVGAQSNFITPITMPRLEELDHEAAPDDENVWTEGYHEFRERASTFWGAFSDFALRDNVLEVAVGLMYVCDLCSQTSILNESE
jgi:hypothetical protein